MSATTGSGGTGERLPVTVRLPRETAERLQQFCRDHQVTADEVVGSALIEYFREGDVSH